MQVKNKQVLSVLEDWENIDWNIDLVSNPRFGPRQPFWDINDYDEIYKLTTSDEYIKDILKGADPRYYSVTNVFGDEPYGKYIFDNMPFDYDHRYTSIYNPKGFVGWHNDIDSTPDEWLILMSYSPQGDGFYKDYNLKTGEIIRTNDKVGWNFKRNHIGSQDEIYWHCAYAPSPRYTWLFGFDTEEKYSKAVDFVSNDARI